MVKQMFPTVHITPSHRRAPHPCWTGPMNLLLRLVFGHGRMRFVSYLDKSLPNSVNVLVRGFSAGSFVGLTVLHLLWKMRSMNARATLGAIACPPKLLEMVPVQQAKHLLLLHYHGDQLCMWRPPSNHFLAKRTVYVTGDARLNNHFGSPEHDYCHWVEIAPYPGQYDAWKMLLLAPDMARRDASAFRLISWLSLSLGENTSVLLSKLMKQLAEGIDGECPALLQIVQDSGLSTLGAALPKHILG